ncbi:MAG: hypothetical protein IK016_11120 [Lachnospiraceae bacterium]|nr:hypothetical protein [Lachnospiraceae bacterium]
MIADCKKAFALLPHMYQAKSNLLLLIFFLVIGVTTTGNRGDGLDLMTPAFLWGTYSNVPASILTRMEYADCMALSGCRKRTMTVIPALLQYVSMILMWCLLVVYANVSGRSADLSSGNALILMGVYTLFTLFLSGISAFSGKMNRVLSVLLMVFLIAIVMLFWIAANKTSMLIPLQSADGAFARFAAGITPAGTIGIIALLGIPLSGLFYLILRITYRRPIRREYLQKLRG